MIRLPHNPPFAAAVDAVVDGRRRAAPRVLRRLVFQIGFDLPGLLPPSLDRVAIGALFRFVIIKTLHKTSPTRTEVKMRKTCLPIKPPPAATVHAVKSGGRGSASAELARLLLERL
jgi:hypothetical protein